MTSSIHVLAGTCMTVMSARCTLLTRRSKSPYNYHSTVIDSYHSYDLPDDLFEDGEVKPTKPQKKKQSNKRASTDVRDFSRVCLELTIVGPHIVPKDTTLLVVRSAGQY